jgi:hypothetical protein
MKLLFVLLLALPVQAFAQSWWTVEARLGTAIQFGTTLEIEQVGQPLLSIDADYSTRPFDDALYYGLRIGWRNPQGAWEVEFLHHKVYLDNNPPEIQHFEVTHGYNMLMLNRTWTVHDVDLRAGGGLVISHTDSTIRSLHRTAGQEITGVVGQISAGKNIYLSNRFYIALESKLTLANATVSIADGEAKVPNIAIHVLAGLGYDLTASHHSRER